MRRCGYPEVAVHGLVPQNPGSNVVDAEKRAFSAGASITAIPLCRRHQLAQAVIQRGDLLI